MRQNKKKVLVVDDDELHLYTTKELLQTEHCEVITHKNGFGVTSLVRSLQPDLILLDINMPALSGDNLIYLIQGHGDEGRIPILFYSSNDEDTLRASAAAHGAQGYVCKGNIADLRKKVEHHLGLTSREGARGNV